MTQKRSNFSKELLKVKGVCLVHLPYHPDERGDLTVGELGMGLPFLPKRYFVVFSVPGPTVRGEHAHILCHQFMLCLKGSLKVMVDDGEQQEVIVLDNPTKGLHVPPMVWAKEYDYSPDATLMVLASELYEPADYIRDYDDFLARVREENHG